MAHARLEWYHAGELVASAGATRLSHFTRALSDGLHIDRLEFVQFTNGRRPKSLLSSPHR